MQQFTVVVKVTANTAATVSEAEIREAVQEVLNDFDGGTAEVETVTEE
jgi:hypothetical protein